MWYNSSMKTALTKGFTLVELLVVIAILAVLATAVVVVLNPAELIKQARDSTRISDLAALYGAVALYYSDSSSSSTVAAVTNCTHLTTAPGGAACTENKITAIDGSGWVNINFNQMASSPLSRIPLDPSNGSDSCKGETPKICMYAYKSSSSTIGAFEIDANMESTKFFTGGAGHITDLDGGNNASWYEVGTNLTLI